MFKLNEKYEINRNILKCDYIRYSPNDLSTINTPNSQTHNNVPKLDTAISLFSYLESNFDVFHAATGIRYVDGNDIKLVTLGPSALFSNSRLTSSSGKHIEDFSHAHIVSLMYKLITSARDTDGLSTGFDRNRNRAKQELTNNKVIKGRYHVRIYLRDIFGFAERQKRNLWIGLQININKK